MLATLSLLIVGLLSLLASTRGEKPLALAPLRDPLAPLRDPLALLRDPLTPLRDRLVPVPVHPRGRAARRFRS